MSMQDATPTKPARASRLKSGGYEINLNGVVAKAPAKKGKHACRVAVPIADSEELAAAATVIARSQLNSKTYGPGSLKISAAGQNINLDQTAEAAIIKVIQELEARYVSQALDIFRKHKIGVRQ